MLIFSAIIIHNLSYLPDTDLTATKDSITSPILQQMKRHTIKKESLATYGVIELWKARKLLTRILREVVLGLSKGLKLWRHLQ